MNPALEHIQERLAQKEIGHAYLFEASRGEDANVVMIQAARMMGCQEGRGCGHCSSCLAFDRGNHPDIITLSREKNTYSVRQIREQLVNDIGIKPYRYPYKIYLIPDAQQLSPLCQNVLLKTLEEPPSYGIILMATDNRNNFLPTVLSRVVCLSAEEGQPEGEDAPSGASSEGSGAWIDFLCRIDTASVWECQQFYNTLPNNTEAMALIKTAQHLLRDIYAAKSGEVSGAYFPEKRDSVKRLADRLTDEGLKSIWRRLELAQKQIQANVRPAHVLAAFSLTLRDSLLESEDI